VFSGAEKKENTFLLEKGLCFPWLETTFLKSGLLKFTEHRKDRKIVSRKMVS
jgi:hypothetical protein